MFNTRAPIYNRLIQAKNLLDRPENCATLSPDSFLTWLNQYCFIEIIICERIGHLVMKLSAQALRALQELDETGRDAVEDIVRAHIRACRLNGFQPENLERVYQEAIEIIRLEGPPKKESTASNKYEPTRRYEQYRSPRAL